MGSVTSLFLRKMVNAAVGEAANADWLRSVGIDPNEEPNPKLMIADTAYYDLLERITQGKEATDLPLRVGASMRCDDYGALGIAFKAAPDLFGSYSRVERYARLWTSVVDYTLEPDGEDVWFALHRSGSRRRGLRLSNEATLASATTIAREVSATGKFTPREVHIQHPAPAITSHHQAFFGCPVIFGSDRDALRISRPALERPNKLGDLGITQFLIGHLEQELEQLQSTTPLRAQLRDAVAKSLSEGLPKMDDIARRLGMSARSLHRRLAKDGLNFQTLTAETRQELAEGLLRDERYSLSEIAFLTGFSEQSAFTRAFKRRSGTTPANYRKNIAA